MLWGLSAVAYLSEKSLQLFAWPPLGSLFPPSVVTSCQEQRFTYDQAEILDGMDFHPVVGFCVSEVLLSIEKEGKAKSGPRKMRELMPSKQDLRDSSVPSRGPSRVSSPRYSRVGPSVASFLAYGLEKRFAKRKTSLGLEPSKAPYLA
jgi:TctA family transporter